MIVKCDHCNNYGDSKDGHETYRLPDGTEVCICPDCMFREREVKHDNGKE